MENQELLLQIARLQDQLEFASDQADTFAKSLKKIYDLIEELQNEDIIWIDLKKIKNSIPENALRRAE